MKLSGSIVGGFLMGLALCQVVARAGTRPEGGLILIADVERFYRVYDAAEGRGHRQGFPRQERLAPGNDGVT